LIPGGGRNYEADYLAAAGFAQVTVVEISSIIVEQLQQRWAESESIQVFHEDFLKHEGQYDLILEQTFFCALHPSLRNDYVQKMKELLAPKGKLVGVLFNRSFEKEGPPFGGYSEDYQNLFAPDFQFNVFEPCYNSIQPRENSELFINITKI
jgi:SAM-dependent methyltransferase